MEKQYVAQFVYKDSQNVAVCVKYNELKDLFQRLKEGEFYIAKNGLNGFWLDLKEVRYIEISVHEYLDEDCKEKDLDEDCVDEDCVEVESDS